MDGVVELAGMLKERENKPYAGPQVGVVVSPPPELKVRLGDRIILDKDHLIISAHVLADYRRSLNVTDGSGQVTLVQPPPPEEAIATETWGVNSAGLSGQMSLTDTLREGDEVILIPSTDIQTYYLVDKAVKL